MSTLLHIDASARPGRAGIEAHGSHTRRLSDHFVSRWRRSRPEDTVRYRDLGAVPPRPVSGQWIHAAFTEATQRLPWMHAVLAESDALIAELRQADVIVMGVPLYNFGPPAPFKAWIDNVVRIGETFGYDTRGETMEYLPLLRDRRCHTVLLSSRGGHGFGPDGPLAQSNHLEPGVRTAFDFMGLPAPHEIAIEHEESGGEHLASSVTAALRAVDDLVDHLLAATTAVAVEPEIETT